jgi:hypothetical protein
MAFACRCTVQALFWLFLVRAAVEIKIPAASSFLILTGLLENGIFVGGGHMKKTLRKIGERAVDKALGTLLGQILILIPLVVVLYLFLYIQLLFNPEVLRDEAERHSAGPA